MKEAKLQWAGTNRPKYSATLNRKGECWVLRRQMEWWQDGLSSPNGFNKLTDSFLPHTVFFPLYLPLFLLLFMSFISIGAGTKFGPLKTFFRWCHCSPRVVMGFCCWAGCQLLVVAHGSPPPSLHGWNPRKIYYLTGPIIPLLLLLSSYSSQSTYPQHNFVK